MKLDNKGYLIITEFEGFSSKPYLCPAKLATIGYGNTFYRDGRKVTMIDKSITKAEAFDMFKDIADFLDDMLKINDNSELRKDRDACVEAVKILTNI